MTDAFQVVNAFILGFALAGFAVLAWDWYEVRR
jgi:hypothetical protein